MATEIILKQQKTGGASKALHFPSIPVGAAIPGRLLLSRAYVRFAEPLMLAKLTKKNNDNQINWFKNSQLSVGAICPDGK